MKHSFPERFQKIRSGSFVFEDADFCFSFSALTNQDDRVFHHNRNQWFVILNPGRIKEVVRQHPEAAAYFEKLSKLSLVDFVDSRIDLFNDTRV